MSTVAVFGMLAGGTAWAASAIGTRDIKNGAVTTKKLHSNAVSGAKLAAGAVTSRNVADFSLRLHDLGGLGRNATSVVGSTTTVPSGGCALFGLALLNPAPKGAIGSLVVGFLTDASGHAVLGNFAAVVPTMVSESSQGGAEVNLMVCGAGASNTVPAGSVFHYHLIGP
jgi:hypothetical protein